MSVFLSQKAKNITKTKIQIHKYIYRNIDTNTNENAIYRSDKSTLSNGQYCPPPGSSSLFPENLPGT